MLDFSRFLCLVERRARRIAGLRRAGPLLAVAAAIVLATQTFLLGVARLSLGWRVGTCIAAALVAAGLVVYLAYRRRKVRLPRLLLRIDQALGLEARVSSLYELRRTAGNRALRSRIEGLVGERLTGWQRGLPWGRLGWATSLAGVLLTAGILALSTVPAPAIEAVGPTDMAEPSITRTTVSEQQPISASTERPRTASAEPSRDPMNPVETTTGQDVRLEDDLASMGGLDTPDTLLGDMRMDEVGELLARQRDAARALSEMLEEMRERMQREGGGLTQEEEQQLREQMNQGLSPEAEQALRDLLSQTDPEALQDLIDEMTQNLSGAAAEESPDEPDGQDEQPSLAIDLDTPDDWEAPSQGDEASDSLDTPQDENGSGSEPKSEGSDKESASEPGPDGDDPRYAENAGSEGIDVEEEGTEEEEASFLSEETPFTIGDEGEFSDFLSKGVPIEPATDMTAGSVLDAISYEQIDALLGARSLTPETMDTVRDYFTRITQGGS